MRPLRLLPLAGLLLAAACADRVTVPVARAAPAAATARIACRVEVRAGTLSCDEPGARGGGARGDVIVGGQGVNVRLISSGTAYDAAAQVLSSNVSVRNLLAQAMGTRTGSDTAAVQVFFAEGPTVTAGTGDVSVANPDGVWTFTASNQPFYAYRGILEPQATSAPKSWRFSVPPTVETFSFTVYVNAPLPDESSPLRWVREGGAIIGDSLLRIAGGRGVVYVTGSRGTLLRHDVNGWARVPPPAARDFPGVAVAEDGSWVALGAFDVSYTWDGRRWTALYGGVGPLQGMAGSSPADLWAPASATVMRYNGFYWENQLRGSVARFTGIVRDPAAAGYLAIGAQNLTNADCGCPYAWASIVNVRGNVATEHAVDSAAVYRLNDAWAGTDGSAVAVGWLKNDSAGPALGAVLTRASVDGAWTRESAGGPVFLSLAGTAGALRYALGEAALYARTPGGWALVPNSAHAGIRRIYLDGDTALYGIAKNTIYRFRNGWVVDVAGPADAPLTSAWAADAGNVFAAGADRILRRGASGWSATPLPGAWHAMAGRSAADVWAVGARYDSAAALYKAALAHFDGNAWQVELLPRTPGSGGPSLRGVWAADAENVFAVGVTPSETYVAGLLVRRTAGGWEQTITQDREAYLDVSGTSPTDVWAVGWRAPLGQSSTALVSHWDGTSWTTGIVAASPWFYGVAAIAPNLAYAVGADGGGGAVYRWDGSAWTRVYQSLLGQDFRHVWASGPDDVWAVGYGGVTVHWDGVAWRALDSGTPVDLIGVTGTSPQDVYAVGLGGLILHAKR